MRIGRFIRVHWQIVISHTLYRHHRLPQPTVLVALSSLHWFSFSVRVPPGSSTGCTIPVADAVLLPSHTAPPPIIPCQLSPDKAPQTRPLSLLAATLSMTFSPSSLHCEWPSFLSKHHQSSATPSFTPQMVSNSTSAAPFLSVYSSFFLQKFPSTPISIPPTSNITLPISAAPIREVLQYMYTCDIPLLHRLVNPARDDGLFSREALSPDLNVLIALAASADYLELRLLQRFVFEAVSAFHTMYRRGRVMCLALELMCTHRDDAFRYFDAIGLWRDTLRKFHDSLTIIERSGKRAPLLDLSAESLEFLSKVAPPEDGGATLMVFQVLHLWTINGVQLRTKGPVVKGPFHAGHCWRAMALLGERWTMYEDEHCCHSTGEIECNELMERWKRAYRLAEQLDFCSMALMFLTDFVERSLLVKPSVLFAEYCMHARRATEEPKMQGGRRE